MRQKDSIKFIQSYAGKSSEYPSDARKQANALIYKYTHTHTPSLARQNMRMCL